MTVRDVLLRERDACDSNNMSIEVMGTSTRALLSTNSLQFPGPQFRIIFLIFFLILKKRTMLR